MKCPRCEQDNPVADAQFCPRCGAPAKHADARSTPAASYVDLQRELTKALEQQTATSDLLKVIGRSTFDLQPVFEMLAANAVRLCDAERALIFRFEGQLLRIVAAYNASHELRAFIEQNPIAPGRQSAAARAALERRTIHIHDARADPEYSYGAMQVDPVRTLLAVPMLRADELLGVILIYRREYLPFTDSHIVLMETFADQAAIAIENARLFTELQDRNRELTEALEQQTATAEILRVISQSPTDVQPVFAAAVASATRLCDAFDAAIHLIDADTLRLVAHEGPIDTDTVLPLAGTLGGRTISARRAIHVADMQTEEAEFPESSANARRLGFRTILSVPLIHGTAAIGTIAIRRTAVRPFTERQVELLKTFADQAVIAIENVRLFNETKEALERQTATSEILRVISTSPTDLMPVLESVARNAARLCEADDVSIIKAEHDGLTILFSLGPVTTFHGRRFPAVRSVTGRAIDEGRTVHVRDLLADPYYEIRPEFQDLGWRSALAVPLLRDGVAIGTITARRSEVRPFSDQQIKLLEIFADQAVIAIENVRLFKELEDKNRALTAAHAQVTETLEQQTATSEILRVISSSPTDVQPVFDAIVRSASLLCDGADCIAVRFDGELMHLMARHNPKPGTLESVAALFPRRPSRDGTATDRAILDGHMVQVPDILEDPTYDQRRARAAQLRSLLSVPLMRAGNVIGTISVSRAVPGLFSERQVELLKTFADQAVIAIENVRLFTELRERTAQLGRSVEELTALGQVSQALSSTLDLETVLTTIVQRAIELSVADGGSVYEYDDAAEEFHLRATQNFEEELVQASRAMPARRGEGALGMVAERREPIQFADISDPTAYQSRVRDVLLRTGYRAILAVPLLRDDRIVGGLVIGRKSAGEFSSGVIDLLTTFANQSALAIQNARLFRELADKSRQLEAASQHKSEFLANMSHELRTPLNAVIGFSEVLSERMFGDLNEKQDEYLRDIHASGQHLLSLINDILDLSKIEAGKMELELSDFDLPMTIDNALMLVRERAGRRSVTLHATVDERLGQVQGDERKLRQVLLNLLSNAIKFTPEGGRIEVGAKPVNGSIEVSVSDTGVGIAPEDQDAVFEEFRQVGTAEKKVEGTGLGLALSRKFIELHGGKIWVKSQVGAGSTFTFTVPVRRGE